MIKGNFCFPRFQRGFIVFQGGLNFFSGVGSQEANFYRNL